MTVLQALNGYYGRMAERGEAEAPGYSREKIGFFIELSPRGTIIQIGDLREPNGKKLIPKQLEVPAAVKRTVGIASNLFWDKSAYVLGRTAGDGRRTSKEHARFKETHLELLAEEEDAGLAALRLFLERWTPEQFDGPLFTPDMLDANLVFRLEGDFHFLHERPAARRLIAARASGDGVPIVCLVTGRSGMAERLHPSIKGVDDAQSSGAALVSFNLNAFTSYGKEQGANAPVSEEAAFCYGAALNRLLDRGTSNQRIKIGDTTVVFWADTSGVGEDAARAAEDFMKACFQPVDIETSPSADTDRQEAVKIRDALENVPKGRPVSEWGLALKDGTRFYVLGLAPNAARLSVRFWLADDFEVFAERLARHEQDLKIDPLPWKRPPSIDYLLRRTTALQEERKNIPNALAGEVMRAILTGSRYPRTLLTAALMRLRAGDNPTFGWHAAVLKACINRLEEEEIPVSLEPDNPSVAYQLGRLFALLESAQYAALGRINSSIGERYYGAASATPILVFGRLLRGSKIHLADARKRGKGGWIREKMTEVIKKLPSELPRTLRLEDQARFAVGYYHECGERLKKDQDKDTSDIQGTNDATN